MKPITPNVTVPGDREDRIMARSGDILGWNLTRVVWRFGFMPDTDLAKVYGCHYTGSGIFLFVLTTVDGKILAKHDGFGGDLPERFNRILETEMQKSPHVFRVIKPAMNGKTPTTVLTDYPTITSMVDDLARQQITPAAFKQLRIMDIPARTTNVLNNDQIYLRVRISGKAD